MFRHSFRLFKIRGIPLKVDVSWFIILLLVSFTLAEGVFKTRFPGLAASVRWQMGVSGAMLLFVSVLLHELAHSVIAQSKGMKVSGITLFVFGGVSEIAEEPPTPVTELWMTAVGPAMSIVIGMLFFGAQALARWAGASTPIVAVLGYVGVVNMILAVFNLVPGFPLDGGRILRALLWMKSRNLRFATRVASYVGSGIGLGLIVLGLCIVFFVPGGFVAGLWFALIGMFLRNAAEQGYRRVEFKQLIGGTPVWQLMTSNPIVVHPRTTIAELVDHYFLGYRHHSFPVVDDAGSLEGFVNVKDVREVPKEEWADATVERILDREAVSLAVSPQTDAVEVMKLLAAGGPGRVPVVKDGNLAGIVSRTDLMKYLRIRIDLGE